MNTLLLVGRSIAEALDLARLPAEHAVERRADEVLASLGGVALRTSGLEETAEKGMQIVSEQSRSKLTSTSTPSRDSPSALLSVTFLETHCCE